MKFREYVDQSFRHHRSDRIDFFRPFIDGKKVLHVGFVDWPKTRVEKNLHLQISPICQQLDGIDSNKEGAQYLNVPNGTIYNDWSEVPDIYDTLLVPEVIEHVGNVKDFLETLDKYQGTLIITAPDAYLMYSKMFVLEEVDENGNNWQEHNHPDHNCWFTPFTLKNTIHKYSKRRVKSLHWLHMHSIAAVCEKD